MKKLNLDIILIDGVRARTWLSVNDVCKACPYLDDECNRIHVDCNVVNRLMKQEPERLTIVFR